jgi:heat shock protein HslJ
MSASARMAILGVLALASGCARLGIGPGAGSASPTAVNVMGAWVLGSAAGPQGPIDVPDGWRVTVVFDADGVHGQACNHYGGSYDLHGSAIGFTEMSMTEMACVEPMMTVEAAYHAALAAVDRVGRDGDTLTMSGPGVELVFTLLPPVPDAALQGTHWILDSLIDGDAVSSVQGNGWLELRPDGTLAGSSGCRALSGRYVVDGDRVVATDLRADGTCSGGLAAQDARVVEVLGDGFGVVVEGGRLTVSHTGGAGLGYIAPRPD